MKRQNVRKLIQLISMLLFPLTIYYFSPVLIVQGAVEGIIGASAITFIVLMVAAIFLGRSFCAYVCPMGAMQEIAFSVNDKKAKLGKRVYIKYGIWGIWFSVIVMNYFIQREKLHLDVSFMMTNGVSISEQKDFIIYYFIVLLFLIPVLIHGRRATCHYLCWMAPFMVLGMKLRKVLYLPGLRIQAEKEKCVGCGKCSKECPMSLDVKEMVQTGKMFQNECILCGKCVDQCPKNVIEYTVKPLKE